jgi:lysophospholipase L1-like esterase
MKRSGRFAVGVAAVVLLLVPFGAAHAAPLNYVALGDSYSSGVGTNHYDLNAACKRSSLAYPALVAAAKGYALNFQACSGATTTDVINKQVTALSSTTNVVTVTAGGNDAGFSSLLSSCTLSNCVASINSTITSVNATLGAKLDAMDTKIKTLAPNATVIVLGYPRLFSGTCFAALGISAAEVTAANNLADAIDNPGVCASSAWLNGLNLANSGESYHPTTTGQSSGYTPLVRAVTG